MAGNVVAGGVAGYGRSAAGGILADGQAMEESTVGGSARGKTGDNSWRGGHLASSTTAQGFSCLEQLLSLFLVGTYCTTRSFDG